ncbi:MAG TPA: AbgT family transporter [Pseudogracilibacillus sp.]|nr:AbgT family transporter [Pseudogracilibacillus sp.]
MTKQSNHLLRRLMSKILGKVEGVGNRLPDPFMLFVSLALLVVVFSAIVSAFDVSFTQPGEKEETAIKSLLSVDGIQYILTSMVDNFIGFKPLGIVLTIMLGIGLADKVGLVETFIKSTILRAPKILITYAVIFVGILGNLAADAAFVIVPPLAALVFYNVGRHPLAGLAAGFAGVGSGFTANVIVSNTDVVLSGLSAEVMDNLDTSATVTPVDNYYFMLASVVLLSVVGTIITEKIVEPRLGTYEGESEREFEPVTKKEHRALLYAGFAGLTYIAVLLVGIFWPHSLLRGDSGEMVPSPFLDGIVPILMFFFLIIGITYGIAVKKIKSSKSIAGFMGEAMKDMSGFVVLIFAAAQFIAYFEWSNIGTWIAVSGASYLENIGITGIWTVIAFVLLTALLNLIIFSGSAQWGVEAPIFLKMFYFLDFHPAFIQVAYRIADSSTNVITPMNPYFIIVLAFVKEYDKKAGLGTLIALMLPYAIIFLFLWLLLLLAFVFFGIPFGPGIGVYL